MVNEQGVPYATPMTIACWLTDTSPNLNHHALQTFWGRFQALFTVFFRFSGSIPE